MSSESSGHEIVRVREGRLISPSSRHIMLVSPNAAAPGEDNGWDFADLLFWEPLLRQHRTLLRKKSLGQMIHHFFPNLKYAVALGAPVRQAATPTASVYVSDRNLIEPRDTKAFRKMVFDTIWEFRHGRNAPRDFTDVKATPEFGAERLNVPEFRDLLHLVKENDFSIPWLRNEPSPRTLQRSGTQPCISSTA